MDKIAWNIALHDYIRFVPYTALYLIQPEEDEYYYDNDNKSPMYDFALPVAISGFSLFTVRAGGLQ